MSVSLIHVQSKSVDKIIWKSQANEVRVLCGFLAFHSEEIALSILNLANVLIK